MRPVQGKLPVYRPVGSALSKPPLDILAEKGGTQVPSLDMAEGILQVEVPATF
jgi:hypothetical protein